MFEILHALSTQNPKVYVESLILNGDDAALQADLRLVQPVEIAP